MSSADFTVYTPGTGTLSYIWSHLLWGEFSAFSAANAILNFPIVRSTRYPSLLGGQRQYGMKSLPNASTHDQQWESNPRPSDLEYNTQSWSAAWATCSREMLNTSQNSSSHRICTTIAWLFSLYIIYLFICFHVYSYWYIRKGKLWDSVDLISISPK